jgi:Ca2+:H+ antiporter
MPRAWLKAEIGVMLLKPNPNTPALQESVLLPEGWQGGWQCDEQLAERTGEGIGGLLNATFGNAAELIIAPARCAAVSTK